MKRERLTAIAAAGVLATGVLTYGVSAQAGGSSNSTDYIITIPQSLTIENEGWNSTTGIKVSKNTDDFDSTKKLTVEATSKNGWTLNQESGDATVSYTMRAEAGGVETKTWVFSANDLNKDGGTTTTLGIDVGNYSDKPAGTYTDTVTFTAKVESAVIAVTGIEIDKTSLELKQGGGTATLTATVSPDDATDKTVTWSSDNEAVATVVDGVVTPVAKGTATITAKAGDKTATCTVTVKKLYSITLTGPYSGDTLVVEYYEGNTWNDMVAKYPDTLKVYSGYAAFGSDGFIYDQTGSFCSATAQIDPNETYEVH